MKKKLHLNTALSLLYQIFTVIIGLIIPRLILSTYGTIVNGIVQSITQMLSVISLLDLGVGAVVQASLYKPLAKKDNKQISIIYSSARKYFNFIAKLLIVYILILIFYYSYFKSTDFPWLFSATLIISISISSFAQYYFGICNTLLLYADQKIYIPTIINLITLILNAFFTVILINLNASIQIVKLVSSLIYLIRPLFLNYYVKNNYQIKIVKSPPKEAIPDKWSGLAQHVATNLTISVDSIVLTLFSTFKNVSIYNVYVMPLNAMRNLIETTSSSYKSFFGTLIAKNQKYELSKEFRKYELLMHFFVIIIFCCIYKVLVPFVLLYTNGINDANYENILFSYLITTAYAIYSLRLPYTTIIISAGKFRETQNYSIIECILNIILSVYLVKIMGISGVAIGTCISVAYRTIMSILYLKKDILYRNLSVAIKQVLIDILCVFIIVFISNYVNLPVRNFFDWIIYSLIIFIICFCITFLIFYLFYKKIISDILKKPLKNR